MCIRGRVCTPGSTALFFHYAVGHPLSLRTVAIRAQIQYFSIEYLFFLYRNTIFFYRIPIFSVRNTIITYVKSIVLEGQKNIEIIYAIEYVSYEGQTGVGYDVVAG